MRDPGIELPKPIGFVLGGGGSLGAVQVGMLRALFERGITPDLVVGTSIGAFNGAVVAADPDNAIDILDHFWRSSKRGDAFPLRGIKPVLHWRRTHQSFYPNDGLSRSIKSVLSDYGRIEDLRLPYGAVAIDVVRGTPVLFREGNLESALLASAAIPGIFPPVNRDGRMFYDGGLGNNVPMRDAIGMGAQSLVVLDTTSPTAELNPPDTLMDLFSYVTEVYARQMVLRDLTELSDVPILYPPSPAPGTMSPLDLDHTEELLQTSYNDTSAYLDLKIARDVTDGQLDRA
ncbi:MAG: patatin-like phospholipase [Ilumatobacteraceae bacterium]|nr:patatin-like phospholipase [Ilumatobacteraceae bacterium]